MKKDAIVMEHLNLWCKGIKNEIIYWNNVIKTNGGKVDKKEWLETTNINKVFELEADIPKENYHENYNFIDIGSGPFSRCGFLTDKVKLNHMALDPLADVYNILKEEAGLKNEINLKCGFVEILDRYVEANSFDMVHMSNSLDHSFDPILGIYQLLNAAKIGGKVILRHNDNEAERIHYSGFHQWNFSVDVENNKFKIWRNDVEYDVNEIFGEYADIYCGRDDVISKFNKVVFIKKKSIIVPENNVQSIMYNSVYSHMLTLIMNECLSNGRDVFVRDSISRIESLSLEKYEKYFNETNDKKIVLYGYGRVGKILFEKLKKTNIEIPMVIDANEKTDSLVEVVKIEDFKYDSTIDKIIITVYGNDYGLIEKLKNKGFESKQLLFVDKFIDLLDQI